MTSQSFVIRVTRCWRRQLLLPLIGLLVVSCAAQDGNAANNADDADQVAWDPSKIDAEGAFSLGVGSGERPLTGKDLVGRVRDTSGVLRPTDALRTDWLSPSTTVSAVRLVRPDSVHDTGTRITIDYARVALDGRDVMLRTMRVQNESGDGDLSDSVWFDPKSLLPVQHRFFALDRDMTLRFEADSVRGEWFLVGGDTTKFAHGTDTPLYASVMSDAIAASLPLTDGYTVTIPTYLYEAKGRVDARVTVLGPDTLRVNGKVRNATKVEVKMEIGAPTILWIDSATRELLRTSVSPQPGFEMRIEP